MNFVSRRARTRNASTGFDARGWWRVVSHCLFGLQQGLVSRSTIFNFVLNSGR